MSRRTSASEPAPIDVYRAPAEPPSRADPPAATGVALVLFDIALVPVLLNKVAFGLQFVIPAAADARSALSWARLLLVGGALALTAGAARLVRAPPCREIARGLRIALVASASAVLLATAISVLLRVGNPTPAARGFGAIAGMARDLAARPAFTVLMAICCRNILGPATHRWLVRTTITATLSVVGLGLVDFAMPYLVAPPADDQPFLFDTVLGIASSATGLAAWIASSLLLWRLRAHLLRAPATVRGPTSRSPPSADRSRSSG